MRCFDLIKSQQNWNFDLPVGGLYLIAKPSTPDEAREAVIERAQNGEALSLKEVQRMIQEVRDRDAELREKDLAKAAEAREREAASVRQTIAELKAAGDGAAFVEYNQPALGDGADSAAWRQDRKTLAHSNKPEIGCPGS